MSVALPIPRAVLFDWDGTLVDGWKAIMAAYNITRVAMGMDPWDEQTVRANVRLSWREAFPVIFGDRWEEAGRIYYEQFGKVHLDYLMPLPGAASLLQTLQARGIFAAVVSNKKGPYLRAEISQLNWHPYFGSIVGAQDAVRDKPHPDPVHLALQGSGCETGPNIWFIGDTEVDLKTAENTGCTGILVRSPQIAETQIAQMNAAAIFNDLDALVQQL